MRCQIWECLIFSCCTSLHHLFVSPLPSFPCSSWLPALPQSPLMFQSMNKWLLLFSPPSCWLHASSYATLERFEIEFGKEAEREHLAGAVSQHMNVFAYFSGFPETSPLVPVHLAQTACERNLTLSIFATNAMFTSHLKTRVLGCVKRAQ